MGETSTVRAKMEPKLIEKVEEIFSELGLSTTQAITLSYKKVNLKKGLPFAAAI